MNKPPGFTDLFPYVVAAEPERYLEFLEAGLGGSIIDAEWSEDRHLRNAQVRFGETVIMVSDARGWGEPTRATY